MHIRQNGLLIKRLRHQKHLTQESLAEAADVSVKTISRAERGSAITAETLDRIAEALDTAVVRLYDRQELADFLAGISHE